MSWCASRSTNNTICRPEGVFDCVSFRQHLGPCSWDLARSPEGLQPSSPRALSPPPLPSLHPADLPSPVWVFQLPEVGSIPPWFCGLLSGGRQGPWSQVSQARLQLWLPVQELGQSCQAVRPGTAGSLYSTHICFLLVLTDIFLSNSGE